MALDPGVMFRARSHAVQNARRLRAKQAVAQTIEAGADTELWDRPDLYVARLIPEFEATGYQDSIWRLLGSDKRVAARGPHGLGKTALAALAVLWFAETRNAARVDWKVVTTAGTHLQLTRFLWPEVRKWAAYRATIFPRHKVMLDRTIKMQYGEASAASVSDSAMIEGAHAQQLLYVFDEAKAIDAEIFDAVEGAFSNAGNESGSEAYALAISTPGDPSGRFYDIHKQKPGLDDWTARHVTVDEAINAGRISAKWRDKRRQMWGARSPIYANRVLGEFASSATDSVIPLEWIEAAQQRWRDLHATEGWTPAGVRRTGIDVARGGGDMTVLAPRIGDYLAELIRWDFGDTMETANKAAVEIADSTGIVDVIGVGAGVYDRLLEKGLSVEPFNASSGSKLTDSTGELGFLNRRAAAWWGLRLRLDSDAPNPIALPPDDELTGDLAAPRYKITANSKIQIESKDKIVARLGRSPDCGDATVMSFAVTETEPPLIEFADDWEPADGDEGTGIDW